MLQIKPIPNNMDLRTERFSAIIRHNHYFAPHKQGDLVEVLCSHGPNDSCITVVGIDSGHTTQFHFNGAIFDTRPIFDILPQGYSRRTAEILYGYKR